MPNFDYDNETLENIESNQKKVIPFDFNETQTELFISRTENNVSIHKEFDEQTLPDTLIKRISLNNQFQNEKLESLAFDVSELKNKKNEKDLFFKSSIDEIKYQLNQAKSAKFFNKKIFFIKSAKSYAKKLFNTLESTYDTKSQAILIINDCIAFNDQNRVIEKALDILINILDELKFEKLTQEKLELYIEELYEKGIRFFGGSEIQNELNNFLPEEFKDLFS